jgi:hypothetical protein
MAFKLTYSDGQETDYDDSTKWEIEAGVLKMGREAGKWMVLVSPSHWATIEVVPASGKDKQNDKAKDNDADEDRDEKADKNDD